MTQTTAVLTAGEREILPGLIETISQIPADKQTFILGFATAIVTAGLHPEPEKEAS